MGLFGKKKETFKIGMSAPAASDARVKILGPGCRKCVALEASVQQALLELGSEEVIDHVTDYAQIAAYSVMSTPALVIDEAVVSYGKVLDATEAKQLLQQKL
ncbi:thioredoxin family protein [Corynebacterium alimapuense]|uniref:Thioredoxin family protein n=2 Tax=Corynebacterium alimapuense TaxID=1576874 RepID=A0A3M8K991_9CORY|nr:thioredoxin family protein [Corynebacterium alimapuense]